MNQFMLFAYKSPEGGSLDLHGSYRFLSSAKDAGKRLLLSGEAKGCDILDALSGDRWMNSDEPFHSGGGWEVVNAAPLLGGEPEAKRETTDDMVTIQTDTAITRKVTIEKSREVVPGTDMGKTETKWHRLPRALLASRLSDAMSLPDEHGIVTVDVDGESIEMGMSAALRLARALK